MVQAIKERAVIQPGGILRIQRSDLPEGAEVEVIVMIQEAARPEEPLPPLKSFWGAGKGVYGSTPEKIDAYLEKERSSWD